MKIKKQLALLVLCLMVLGAGSPLTVAAGQEHSVRSELQADPEIMRTPAMQVERGEIISIDNGRVLIRGSGGSRYGVAAMLDVDTYIVAGESGKLKRSSALKIGQQVTLYYSSIMTRSIPPQARAFAIVIGAPGEKTPQFFKVAQVEQGDGYVRVLSSNHNLIATIGSAACVDYAKIRTGDKLLLWSSMMTMSIPAQTNAEKAVILP